MTPLPRSMPGRLAAALLVVGLLLAGAAAVTLPAAQAQRQRAADARHEASRLLAELGPRGPAGPQAPRVAAPAEALVQAARRALAGHAGPPPPRVAARRPGAGEDAESAAPAGITVEPIDLPAAAALLEALAADPALPGLTADRLRLVSPAPGRWRLELSASVPRPPAPAP